MGIGRSGWTVGGDCFEPPLDFILIFEGVCSVRPVARIINLAPSKQLERPSLVTCHQRPSIIVSITYIYSKATACSQQSYTMPDITTQSHVGDSFRRVFSASSCTRSTMLLDQFPLSDNTISVEIRSYILGFFIHISRVPVFPQNPLVHSVQKN